MAMNLVGNNVYHLKASPNGEVQKTMCLLYKDFTLADNLIIILHGKVISIVDIMDK